LYSGIIHRLRRLEKKEADGRSTRLVMLAGFCISSCSCLLSFPICVICGPSSVLAQATAGAGSRSSVVVCGPIRKMYDKIPMIRIAPQMLNANEKDWVL
jgi:hypothetical protein